MLLTKIFSNNKHFMPFDRGNTNGRKVFIDSALIPRYIELIESKAVAIPMRLGQAIKSLRAVAGSCGSDSNINNAFSHRTRIDGVEIAYTVLQGGSTREGGVYVTDLRLKANRANMDQAGLYDVTPNDRLWDARKASDLKLRTYCGVISAGSASILGEADKDETTNECGQFLDDNAGATSGYDGNFHLFFTPGSLVDSEGTWLTANQKRLPPSALAQDLANTLRQVEVKYAWENDAVTWYVLEDGAKVLLQALKFLPAAGKTQLTKSTFVFANPRESLAELKFALQKVGITLTADMIKANSLDLAARARQQFAQQRGLAILKDQKLIDNNAKNTRLAVNKDLLKKIGFFEEAVKKQMLGAAQGWS